MLSWLLRQFARLPLPVVHALGIVAGWMLFFCSRKYANRLQQNLQASGLCEGNIRCRRLLRLAVAEAGKGTLETLAIWFSPMVRVLNWVQACHGWEHVDAALAAGRGIVFLTPHLGCFEITSLYYATRHPIQVLYRPPRQPWLEPLIYAGRERGQVNLAPTNLRGVRSLLRALKRGEAVGILPDQVPSAGEGEWADFFGRPAYTMTLVSRLVEATGATVLLAFGERLPRGNGYIIHFRPLAGNGVATPATLNHEIEKLVRECPQQYLWSYARYKTPRGVKRRTSGHQEPNSG